MRSNIYTNWANREGGERRMPSSKGGERAGRSGQAGGGKGFNINDLQRGALQSKGRQVWGMQ